MKYRVILRFRLLSASLPLRECGLKSQEDLAKIKRDLVTPLAGVWIEIPNCTKLYLQTDVTPLAGVWIEIMTCKTQEEKVQCHSPCGSVD